MKRITTTMGEMNRLYGEYYDAFCREDYHAAEETWNTYVGYARLFSHERGLKPLPEPGHTSNPSNLPPSKSSMSQSSEQGGQRN